MAATPFRLATALALLASAAPAADRPDYNRDVRPILAENCFACHGPDAASRKAKLRLDVREDALKAEAFVPGKPDESAVIERVLSGEADLVMPPPESHKKLTPAQKETLRRWVAAGAEYQSHWSFIPPKRPAVPKVADGGWARNPIDAFVLAGLEKRGLKPAPEADRRTLARRLSFDLTGLPPEPADVEAFVADPAPDAYERFVDRLMATPQWGEHRGRYWLDYARYADTHGIHFDNFREMWSYRDWVIKAFNGNVPFDRFTVEQLAGDLLPDATLDQRVASGFNRCNITTNEGGVIAEEYLVLYTRDRTETTAQVWMGLTAGCAVCHDHKFDPLSMKDFYSMAAFFNNTTQGAMDGNIPNTPPTLPVPRPEDRSRLGELTKLVAAKRQALDARKAKVRPEFDKWLAAATPGKVLAEVPHQGLRFHAPLTEGTGTTVTAAADGQVLSADGAKPASWADGGKLSARTFRSAKDVTVAFDTVGDFEKDQPFACACWVKFAANAQGGPVVARMDEANGYRGWDLWLEGGKLGAHLVSAWDKDAVKVLSNAALKANEWHHVVLSYDGSGKAAGVKLYVNGVPQAAAAEPDALTGSIRTDAPFKLARRHGSALTERLSLQDVRVYGRALTADEAAALPGATRAAALAARPADKRTDADKTELFDWWLPRSDKETAELARGLGELTREEAGIKARGTVAHVMQEKTAEPTAYMLHRGEYDQRRDKVTAETPKALPPFPAGLPRNRLGFAQWLLRPEHPLTARVTVNRFWQEVFGTGIVRTSGDFGVTGEQPSHPELLDWLAVEFREGGWDVKRFFKLLVTSAAYRQSAAATPEKAQADPANRLVSRGPRFRMDAEMVRDSALAAGGLLVRKVGGPSVKPYQPEGVWEAVAMIGSNTRDYRRDSGESLYRRSMYTLWKRSAPPAAMDVLNAPNRETCTVRRERTNTPLQALLTLNDVQFVEAARALAERAVKEAGPSADARLDFIARRALSRPLKESELPVARSVAADLLAHYKAKPDEARKLVAFGESKADPSLDPAELAAWAMTANQFLNLDEALNK